MTVVDLRELAIDRGTDKRPSKRFGLWIITRYLLPAALLFGFASLVIWTTWDLIFPPRLVKVSPVIALRSEARRAGTPLFKAAGWIEPRPTPIRVAALAPGVVERLMVVEDQAVHRGDVIAELVKNDAELAYQRALAEQKLRAAELEEAQAAYVAAKTRFENPVHLDAPLADAKVSVAQVETQIRNLPHEIRRAEVRRDLARQDAAGKDRSIGAVSQLSVAQSRSELATAEAQLSELRERTGSLEREREAAIARRDAYARQRELLADEVKTRDEAKARLDAASSRTKQASIVIDEAKLRLDRMTIRAPVDGRVFRLIVSPGASLGSGASGSDASDGGTVVTLYQPEKLQVRVDVRFEDIPRVSQGQPVQIENPGLSTALNGHVLFASSLVNIQKNTLEVKVGIDNPPTMLRPEMLVNATFLAPAEAVPSKQAQDEIHLYLPQDQVHNDEGAAFVWVADGSAGVARRTPIKTGAVASGNLIEVVSGLTVSSRIIVGGHEALRDGQRIQIAGESSGASETSPSPAPARHDSRLHGIQ